MNVWIKFPQIAEEINNKKRIFYQKYMFPNAIGAIDGTPVAITTPPRDHAVYPVFK